MPRNYDWTGAIPVGAFVAFVITLGTAVVLERQRRYPSEPPKPAPTWSETTTTGGITSIPAPRCPPGWSPVLTSRCLACAARAMCARELMEPLPNAP